MAWVAAVGVGSVPAQELPHAKGMAKNKKTEKIKKKKKKKKREREREEMEGCLEMGLFIYLFILRPHPWYMEVPRLGSNQSGSRWPTPQPQQRQI